MFTTPAVDLPRVAALLGQARALRPLAEPRARTCPSSAASCRWRASPRRSRRPATGQVRALLTHAGNPVLSRPNGARLDRALAKLEFMVAIDVYLNETTRHAAPDPAADLRARARALRPVIFHGVAIRNTAKYSPAAAARSPRAALHDWEILVELDRRGSRARAAARGSAARVKRVARGPDRPARPARPAAALRAARGWTPPCAAHARPARRRRTASTSARSSRACRAAPARAHEASALVPGARARRSAAARGGSRSRAARAERPGADRRAAPCAATTPGCTTASGS